MERFLSQRTRPLEIPAELFFVKVVSEKRWGFVVTHEGAWALMLGAYPLPAFCCMFKSLF